MDTKNISDLDFPEPINSKGIINDLQKHKESCSDSITKSTYTADELLNRKIDKMPCLVEPILPKVGLAALAGSSDTGKSTFLRQLAVSIALGQSSFLGWNVCSKHQRAIYVSTEDDDYAISYLLRKTYGNKNIPNSAFRKLHFIFDTTDLLVQLENQLEQNLVDLIVIDAFADLYGKSMNDTNQVRTFLNDYSQLAQKYKCLIIFLHHTGKRTEELEPSKHNLLGSQGFEAKMRLVIELRNSPRDSSTKHICIVKGNYLPREHKEMSYALNFTDDLEFINTGGRCQFSELKAGEKRADLKTKVQQLKYEGKKQEQIAEELNISQSKVSRIINEA